jgi:hypothetical protein
LLIRDKNFLSVLARIWIFYAESPAKLLQSNEGKHCAAWTWMTSYKRPKGAIDWRAIVDAEPAQ